MRSAGYAAVLGLSQAAIQDMIRVAYLANDIEHTFTAEQEVGGLIGFKVDFFLDAPNLVLAAEYGQEFTIRLTGRGPMTVSLARMVDGRLELVPELREVTFTAELLVPHAVTIEDGFLNVGFEPIRLELQSSTFTPLVGGPFSAGAVNLLNSPTFHDALEQAMRANLVGLGDSFPSLDIGFLDLLLGPVTATPAGEPAAELLTTTRSFDGALAIGIDVMHGSSGTAGRPQDLSDVTEGLSVGLWVDPTLWTDTTRTRLLEGSATTAGIRTEVEDAGADLLSFVLALAEGRLDVSGLAAYESYGTLHFSFEIYPRLMRPATVTDLGSDELGNHYRTYTPAREELWFEVENIEVDVQRSAWVRMVEIISGGLAAVIVQVFVTMARNSVIGAIAARESAGANRVTLFQPAAGGPTVTAKLEAFRFHVDGIFMGLSMTTAYPRPRVRSPSHGGAADFNEVMIAVTDDLRTRPIVLRVELSHLIHPADPYLKVAWTIRNGGDNSILITADGLAAEHQDIAIHDFDNALSLGVSCRVYRALGTEIVDVFNGRFRIRFADSLDRTKPFVRWHHYVGTPDVRPEQDGSQTVLGYHIKYRTSRIHRTDFPGRCWMAARFSLRAPRGFRYPASARPRLESLAALPFPYAQLVAQRHQVCDYCFFGSPVATQPLVLPG